jgi:pyruvate ferredoxin oxidoreductase delta subunit
MKEGTDGYYHPDFDYCKGCGICANECPAHAIKMKAEEVI